MKWERSERLLAAIGDIDDRWIMEAAAESAPRRTGFWRLGTAAAAVCLLLGTSVLLRYGIPDNGSSMSSGAGSGMTTGSADGGTAASSGAETAGVSLYSVHREDFSSDISPEIVSALLSSPELNGGTHAFKVYEISNDNWFLSESLTDFSQALSGNYSYAVSDGEQYARFTLDEQDLPVWGMTVHTGRTDDITFTNLTDQKIETALADVQYEDYIVTYSARLYTIIIWARGEEDYFLTYPARPDLTGLKTGGIYTLAELQDALCASYVPYGDPDTDA